VFQRPVRPAPWSGIRDAIELPPACPQPTEGMAYIEYHRPGFNKTSEDCLYLNVYVPRVCYVMLCYVMLCYVMLCYVTLRYVTLRYVMLCYVMLCYVMLCYVMLCYVVILPSGRAPVIRPRVTVFSRVYSNFFYALRWNKLIFHCSSIFFTTVK